MSLHKLHPSISKDRDGRLPQSESYIVGTLALGQRNVGLHAIEIGTFYGETTTSIARAMPNHLIITVDIPKESDPKFELGANDARFIGKTPEFGDDVKHRIDMLRTDSALLELPELIELGFAFIDGAHTYEYAKNDFAKIKPRLIPGGVVVFHDVFGEVGRAVQEIIASTPDWEWSAYGGTSLVWGKCPR